MINFCQTRTSKILLLAVIIYFATIRISNLSAAEDKPEGNGLATDSQSRELGAQGEDFVLRDPFTSIIDLDKVKYQPSVEARAVKMPSFPMELRGVMIREENSVAIINEDIVVEGQIWREFKVERIDSKGVTLNFMEEILQLKLKQITGGSLAFSRPRDAFARGEEFFAPEEVLIGASGRR